MKELDELLKKVEELSDFAHRIKLLTNLEPEEFLGQLIKYGLANEPQKVKVPAFVAEWIEWSQNHKWALSNVVDASNIKYFEDHSEPTGLTSWFVKKGHDEILARAWLDGYEAEEEPRWMVKSNQLYFTGVTQLIAHDPLTYNFVKDQKHAHIFDDKKSAEKEASYFNGTVEKVEE